MDLAHGRLVTMLAASQLWRPLAFHIECGILERIVTDGEFVDPSAALLQATSDLGLSSLPVHPRIALCLSDVAVRVGGWCSQQGYQSLGDAYLRRAGETLRLAQEECVADLQSAPLLRAQCAVAEAQVLCYLRTPEPANRLIADLLGALSRWRVSVPLPLPAELTRAELEARFGLCAVSDACGEARSVQALLCQMEEGIRDRLGTESPEWLRFLRLRGSRALRLGAHESRQQLTAEADSLLGEAERDFTEGLALTSRLFPADPMAYARASSDLSVVYLLQERFDDAANLAAEAYRLVTEARGGQLGPICAPFAYNLMKAYVGQGRDEEAAILVQLIARWEAPSPPQ